MVDAANNLVHGVVWARNLGVFLGSTKHVALWESSSKTVPPFRGLWCLPRKVAGYETNFQRTTMIKHLLRVSSDCHSGAQRTRG